ncbi:uroporphyrinogen-III synthase [Jiella pelagia]|uniref:Uroporphyrinogen-III synthase n=1 Tax=Jiella pelagia TaxID=2986949 RepID=A0ABY7BXW0_9HYPH|nr:uroporphyrinogen-III synthase [Jiella pelagia]WAP68252.1 uroporphyrinogen-III synthase [Jiella pelagia]
MARVLILREAGEAERTARQIAERGHQPLILPLERSVDLESSPEDTTGGAAPAGFALTSGRAVGALAKVFCGDPRPVLCVGEATGEAARQAGFANVHVAEGAASAMGRLAREAGIGPGETLLYAAGRRRTGTLERALGAVGISYGIWEVYDIVPVAWSEPMVRSVFIGGPPDVVLLLSAGQAEGYLRLSEQMPQLFHPQPVLLALSARVAEALAPRANARIAAERNLASLFECLG